MTIEINLELYYPTGAVAHGRAAFGRGTGPILMDDVQCNGNEQRLVDCQHIRGSNHNCFHAEDAGVTCLRSKRQKWSEETSYCGV